MSSLDTRGPVAPGTGGSAVDDVGSSEDLRGVKRYQLLLPNTLYARVHRAAEERDVTVVQLLRSFIKIGLMVLDAEKDPDGALILRTQGTEKQVVLL